MIYKWKKIVRYGLPILTLCIIIEIFAGQFLQGGQNILLNLPIFLISFPVINSVGGNIGCILGSRIASGLHLGDIKISLNDKKMHENLITSLFMGIVTYIILSILIYYISLFNGIIMNVSLIKYAFILIVVGILLICIVSIASIITAFFSFKKGMDPDDFVAPVVTTIGDTMGIIFLFLLIGVVGI